MSYLFFLKKFGLWVKRWIHIDWLNCFLSLPLISSFLRGFGKSQFSYQWPFEFMRTYFQGIFPFRIFSSLFVVHHGRYNILVEFSIQLIFFFSSNNLSITIHRFLILSFTSLIHIIIFLTLVLELLRSPLFFRDGLDLKCLWFLPT